VLTEKEIAVLEFLFTNGRNSLGRYSSQPSNGVPQGGTSSPILFDVFAEPLIDALKTASIFVKMFADDLVVTGNK
jgi:hypothetical protein